MRLLFLNALKGLRKKKIQMFGIIIMVMLSTAVYVGMNSAIDRLENKYYDYLEEQNVEDISIAVNIDYSKDISVDMLRILRQQELSMVTELENSTLDMYEAYLMDENHEYNLALLEDVQNIFITYGANYTVSNQILDAIKDTYDFTYELEKSKTIMSDSIITKVLPYDLSGMNQTYVIEGRAPEADNEITILPAYARTHKIKIKDTITLADKKYTVVGFAYAPDYIYPMLSFSMPIFDEKNNNIVYMTNNAFASLYGISEAVYSITYNYDVPRKFEIEVTSEEKQEEDPMMDMFKDPHIVMDAGSIMRIGRIGALQLEFASNRLFAEYFLYLLLAISVVIIVIITKKRIDDERLQIGVLKSLGYNRFSIATSYLVYPVVGSIIGGALGFIIGILVHEPIANILLSYYCVPLDHFTISFSYLKTSILVPMIMLSLLSYVIALFLLRKKPLSLLKEGSNLKVNIFSRICNKLTSFLPFASRFKYSMAFRSLGKLFIVTLTSFCTGLLIILILIGMNLFNDMIDKSFAGIDYKYMVSLNGIEKEEIGDSSKTDYILNANIPLTKIEDKNGKEKKIKEEDVSFSINGLDTKTKFTQVLDANGKNLNKLLETEDAIIVNENAKELLHLSLGDTLTFTYQNIHLTYTVVAFSSEYMGYGAYINRENLSRDLGFDTKIYSSMYSNDEIYGNLSSLKNEDVRKIANVLSTSDLKNNISKQMDRFNGSMYLVVAFASVMALIIIAVIANIVVEENKKTISLMKVMGYSDKSISNIILNIYTPFIVLAYFLSVPVMINILKWIAAALIGDMEVTLPITITPIQIMIGLVGLLVAYYIAIAISKRVLKKVPLSIALKRE